jgi:hypothetical protein
MREISSSVKLRSTSIIVSHDDSGKMTAKLRQSMSSLYGKA